MLTLEASNIIITIINLLVLYVLMRKFLINPVRNIMEQRRQLIEGTMEEARAAKEGALEMKKDYEGKLASADTEARAIVAEARDKATAEYDKRIAACEADIERRRVEAKERMDSEWDQTKRAIRSEVASVAMAAAVKVMGEKNTAFMDEEAYNAFLGEMGETGETTAG
ncbi:MAG: ATP synthase F0 subunit B [Eubacterium sp.]|nr:ATP synthase F0 subunit B [Eubacterium sp.]